MQPSQGSTEGISREKVAEPKTEKNLPPEEVDFFLRKPEPDDLPPTTEATGVFLDNKILEKIESMPAVPKVLKDTARMLREQRGRLNEIVRTLLIQAMRKS